MDPKAEYEEAGRINRHLTISVQAAFVGYVAVLCAVTTLTIQLWDKHPAGVPLLLLLASPIGIVLWQVDNRIRELYHAAVEAAHAIETGERGYLYARLMAAGGRKGYAGPHTVWARAVYIGYSALMLVAAGALLWNGYCSAP